MNFEQNDLTSTGIPKASPLNRPVPPSGMEFDFQTDRGAIRTSKIRDFNFSSGNGGTLTLGGVANGNGLLQIDDASGSIVVQGDNAGITIYGGNLLVKNADNTTIIDTGGIVSTANFPNDQATSSVLQTTASTSYTDVSGSTLATLTLDRSANVFFFLAAQGYLDTILVPNQADEQIQIYDTEAATGRLNVQTYGNYLTVVSGATVDYYVMAEIASASGFVELAAGAHTFKLRFKTSDALASAKLSSWVFGYIVFGS